MGQGLGGTEDQRKFYLSEKNYPKLFRGPKDNTVVGTEESMKMLCGVHLLRLSPEGTSVRQRPNGWIC